MTGDFFTLKHSMCYSRCVMGLRLEGMRLIRPFVSLEDRQSAPHNDKLTIGRANYQTLPREVKDDTARCFDC